jgi:hypothetical protein
MDKKTLAQVHAQRAARSRALADAFKPEQPLPFDQFYAAKAQAQRDAIASGAIPGQIAAYPSMDELYAAGLAQSQEQAVADRQKQALIDADRPLTEWELLHLPPNDPRLIESKKRFINRDYYAALDQKKGRTS